MPITETKEALILTFGEGSSTEFRLSGNTKTLSPAALSIQATGFGEAIARTILNNDGKSNFVQMPSAAKRFSNIGETSAKWSASKESEVVEVEHGLGVKPINVNLTIENTAASAAAGLTAVLLERTKTKFKFKCSCNEVINTTFPVTWEAAG